MRIKTIKEYNRDRKKCTYCGGTTADVFDIGKPCPNCSSDVEIIMTREEVNEEINNKINYEITNGEYA